MSDENSQGGAPATWLDWIGFAAAGALVLGPLLGWFRVIPALPAFYLFVLGGLLSVIAGVSALIQAARGRGFGAGRTAALLGGMIFIFTTSTVGRGSVTNDFTTDLHDPPVFEHAATLPANAARDMAYDPSFEAEQKKCCADLASLELPVPVEKAFEVALQAARAMPAWTVVWDDPASGRIEAVVVTRVFGFKDDVAIRVRSDGTASRLDMRSKSRDGRGDIGANSARIRAYLASIGDEK
ncbi:MAG: DUF1499 domain-containing protein [Candidatus Binatia bacterium]|nr:DUF1499 domain-containing protein [Candidatus Binatia bacterium]